MMISVCAADARFQCLTGEFAQTADAPVEVTAPAPIRICKETIDPCEPHTKAIVHDITTGKDFDVDDEGYILDREAIGEGDLLWAVAVNSTTTSYRVLATSGEPVEVIDKFFTGDPAEMRIAVGLDDPLILFDLDVAAEWYVQGDPQYADWLEGALIDAGRYLYEFTEGQMTLGEIAVSQSMDGWDDADVRLLANNSLRPNAEIGGIGEHGGGRSALPGDLCARASLHGIVLESLRRAAQSAGDGRRRCRAAGDVGRRLGHGLRPRTRPLPALPLRHLPRCRGQRQRRDRRALHAARPWATSISRPTMPSSPTPASGRPSATPPRPMPDTTATANGRPSPPGIRGSRRRSVLLHRRICRRSNLTEVFFLAPSTPAGVPAPSQVFDLNYQDGESSSGEARVFIYRNDRVMEQGKPAAGINQASLVGAQIDDRLCVYDVNDYAQADDSPRHQFGCEPIQPGDASLDMTKDLSWAPVILLTQVATDTLTISVTQEAGGAAHRRTDGSRLSGTRYRF